MAEGERHLGVDAVAQVHPMGMILGRGQHQLGRREIAGIEIQRPRLGVPAQRSILGLPGVCLAV